MMAGPAIRAPFHAWNARAGRPLVPDRMPVEKMSEGVDNSPWRGGTPSASVRRMSAQTPMHASRPAPASLLTEGDRHTQRLLRLSALLAHDPNPLSQDMARTLLSQAFALSGGRLRAATPAVGAA